MRVELVHDTDPVSWCLVSPEGAGTLAAEPPTLPSGVRGYTALTHFQFSSVMQLHMLNTEEEPNQTDTRTAR